MFLCIIFWNAKIIYYSYVFKEAKLAKFIRYEALWKLYIFYHKVLGDVVKRWRFWGLWGTLEIVKTWSWNILLFEEILHYAALRSEWHGSVFYSRLGIWIILNAKIFYYSYIIKEAKLAKFIRFEAGWKLMWDEVRDASISITKFTEMGWNDCVFEHTEEHRRCCGKCTSFSVYACRKEHILL